MDLDTPIDAISRSYKMYAKRLSKLGIEKLGDFLFHIPFRYDDFSLISEINKLQEGEIVTIKGKVVKIGNSYTRKWKSLQKAIVRDGTGEISVIWFNQPYLTKTVKEGEEVSLSGKVDKEGGKLIMKSPDYEIILNNQSIHTGRLVPIYPETRGITSKWIRRQVFKILKETNLEDYLPQYLIKDNGLMNLSSALNSIHFPNSLEEAEKARYRLSFDEMLKLHLASIRRKEHWKKDKIKPWKVEKEKIEKLIKNLPFELTNAQKNATQSILSDLSSNTPMNRLLEGDVGSGKTIVAAIASYAAYLNGFQTAFMAPTEILANQHFNTLRILLSPLGLKIELFTSNSKNEKLDFDIAVGTHALIHKKASFKKLGLIVIDEQQRFGVEQRASLKLKGENPHLLTMTATPIPRTVALTMYGDLDLSVLDEMPKGRINIKTWLVPPSKREGAYGWIKEKIKNEKDQVFIVCPLIEESENLVSVKAAKKEYERLSKDVFPKFKLGLLHGKLKAKEKEEVLGKFRNRQIDILVATPVVEVGIDIPTATIMLIEEAERFGLAQLHQLRGRVGRGIKQSFCLLFTSSTNPITLERIKAMETIYSGPQLAELDLKLRGPGQIYGTLQHGIPLLKVASFADFELIEKTKKEAEKLFESIEKHSLLLEEIKHLTERNVSPD
jgi:ATP-dependent DNA helicase RecG